MEKKIISFIFFVFFHSTIFSQKIQVVDENEKPIFNVSFYKKDLSIGEFSNYNGEINLSIFNENDSIIIQHPTFKTLTIIKKNINNKIQLKNKIVTIDEVVISVNRWKENLNDVTNKTLQIPREIILENSPQNSADLLEKTGDVFVQKSQHGGGSPMIRGFSANRILISLDGTRLNNVIYRSGNIHNIITIDPYILEGIEVLFGPASVMYGSDAIGGALNFQIIDPSFHSSKAKLNGSQNIQYNSSSNSKHYNLNFGISSKNISSLSSFSFNSFKDLRSGSKRKDLYPDYGKRLEYVKRNYLENRDEIIQNNNYNVQRKSGYSQINIINKINLKLNNKLNLIYGLYYSNSSNVPRYDRLILYDDIFTPSYSEWYYGPNTFLMNSIKINSFKKNNFFDAFKLNLSHQKVNESRHIRKFNNDNIKNRYEIVNVLSLNLDFDKKFDNSELFYGIESIYNNVTSTANEKNIVTENTRDISTRYPDLGSNYYSNSFYISLKRNIKKLKTNIGLRANSSSLKSLLSNSFYNFPFSKINVKASSISGNLGMRYDIGSNTIKFQYSNGFRTPNLDDTGKIFDSEPGNIIIPNPDLKPEYANNFEVNHEFIGKKIEIKSSLYYIRLNNAIIRSNGLFNNQDSIIYDGIMSRVQTLTNGGKAFIIGFSNNLKIKLSNNLILENSISYNTSKDLLNERPLRHSPPLFGKTSLSFKKKSLKLTYHIDYNGRKNIVDFSQSELNKLYLYTKDGSPSWMTHNLSLNYDYNYFIKFNISIDNIFDIHYRTYSSGISAPGRNINLGLNFKF